MTSHSFVSITPRVAAPAAAADPFSHVGVRIPYAAEEEIYAQDEDSDLVYRVVRGAVRTSRLLSDGRRQIGDFYYAGDFFGLEPGDHHRFTAEALIDSEILVVKRSALKHYSAEGVDLERLLWAATAKELARTQEHLMLLARKTAREKVASFMLDLADRNGAEVTVLPMGRQDMADYLGLTIETVSRTLTCLQSEGLIEFFGNRRFCVRGAARLARLVVC
jgi:CRP/FNR family nitrogen fixation transcriptional regulator